MLQADSHSNLIAPQKTFFYGWYLPAAALVMTLCYGIFLIYGFGVLLPSIIEETGWSRAEAAGVYGILTAEVGLLGPVYGTIISRFGSRVPMIFGSVLGGVGLMLMSRSNTLIMFYASFAASAAGFGVFYFGPTAAITNWFKKNRGLCIGIVLAGSSLSGAFLPVLQWAVDSFGWRETLMMGGGITILLCVPLSLVFRFRPEPYGYTVDGDTKSVVTSADGAASSKLSLEDSYYTKLANLVKHKSFWFLICYYIVINVSVTAIFPHIVVYFKDVGIAEATTALVFSAYAIVSIISRIGGGAIGDRYNKRYTLAIASFILALGMFGTGFISSTWHVIFFVLLIGPAFSVTLSVVPTLVADVFGARAFAIAFSWIMLPGMLVSLVGPGTVGWLADVNGTYRYAFLGLAVIILSSVPMILKVAESSKNANQ